MKKEDQIFQNLEKVLQDKKEKKIAQHVKVELDLPHSAESSGYDGTYDIADPYKPLNVPQTEYSHLPETEQLSKSHIVSQENEFVKQANQIQDEIDKRSHKTHFKEVHDAKPPLHTPPDKRKTLSTSTISM